jgi:stalled ribosome rescue protein Dom34
MHYHAVVWIDHHEAHVQSFTHDEAEHAFIVAHGKHRQVHHRKGSIGGAKAPEDQEFFARVAHALDGEHEVLVVGPAQAKHEFVKYLQHHLPALAKRVIGVETVDHPTDGQLLKHARRFFRAADRMLLDLDIPARIG